jgi:hypothetical protein
VFLVCGKAAFGVFNRQRSSQRSTILGLIAILYNPFLPIHFHRPTWVGDNSSEKKEISAIDLFCGGGGTSLACSWRPTRWAQASSLWFALIYRILSRGQ